MARTSGNLHAACRALCAALAISVLGAGCGIYSFSGSTLPSHLKTVEIPLFANQSLQSGVAEQITAELGNQVLSSNLLKTVNTGGDASLSGVVTSYVNQEYQYDIKGERRVDVLQYMVTITVSMEFLDRKKNEPLYSGMVRGQGTYAFGTETETQGRQRAVEDVVRQILENSLKSW